MALLHQCGADCKAYQEKEAPFDIEEIKGYKFRQCAFKDLDQNIWWWIKAFNMYEKGILPNNDGWLYQSNKFLEIINFINSIINEKEVADAAKQSRNNIIAR